MDNEAEIDFSDIGNGKSSTENKYYWEKLKKLVSSRFVKNINEMLIDLLNYFKSSNTTPKYEYNKKFSEDSNPVKEKKGEKNINRFSLIAMFEEQDANI